MLTSHKQRVRYCDQRNMYSSTILREMRDSARALEASCNGIVRRMVSLPRSISRALGGSRTNQHLQSNYQLPYQEQPQEEWQFLSCFEQQYGSAHPFFYACQFSEALKIAEDEHKLVFMYLHSPEHPFTASFCRDTLCSELVVQFLDANFVSWGGLAHRGQGLQMAATLSPVSFPCCAVIAPASGTSIAVLQQMEGPISPAQLVEVLQRTMEEKGIAFGTSKRKEQEKIRADRQLRQEQDAAYLAALQIDKDKEKLKNSVPDNRVQKPLTVPNRAGYDKFGHNAPKKQSSKFTSQGKDPQATQILIRFPNGERREQSFSSADKIRSLYDSLGLIGGGSYRLISSFPRKAYGVEQMGMTLKEAGLHPRASLFLEPL